MDKATYISKIKGMIDINKIPLIDEQLAIECDANPSNCDEKWLQNPDQPNTIFWFSLTSYIAIAIDLRGGIGNCCTTNSDCQSGYECRSLGLAPCNCPNCAECISINPAFAMAVNPPSITNISFLGMPDIELDVIPDDLAERSLATLPIMSHARGLMSPIPLIALGVGIILIGTMIFKK